ncbi:MAG: ABC transporter permease subunit [Candidatus Contendobacter sp.]|nr:ABC transporter permease subunit [Candidatus Contendobacter sp.]
MMLTIAAREWRSLFLSPLAWTLLAAAQGLLAWIFLLLVQDFRLLQGRLTGLENAPGVTDLVAAPLFRAAAWCLLLITPLLTMRLFSEERRARTFDLLLSAPVGTTDMVFGKYLSVVLVLWLVVGLAVLMPLSLSFGATLDFGKLLAGTLGLGLLAAGFAAAGLYLSTLTAQPMIAAAATFGVLLGFWIVDLQETTGRLFGYLSPLRHYDGLLLGLVNSADLAYYLLFSATFLGLAIRRLDDLRLRD